MNKLATLVLCGCTALSLGLASCAKSQSGTEASQESEAAEASVESAEETIVGGWVLNDEAKSSLSDEENKLFEEAIAQMPDFVYEPTALIAKKTAVGDSYAFLCRGKSPNTNAKWYVAVVNKGVDGTVSLSFVIDLDIPEPRRSQEAPHASLLGTWQVIEPGKVDLVPSEAQVAFEKAAKGYNDIELKPYVVLGSQLVAGNNYLYLCSGTTQDNKTPSVYVVRVYADLEGNAEFTEVAQLDLTSYVSPAA